MCNWFAFSELDQVTPSEATPLGLPGVKKAAAFDDFHGHAKG
jgi:hypothetical protein